MKSRKRFINTFAGDVHIPSPAKAEHPDVELSDEITKRMNERNRHIGAINNALDKLLDGEMTPEEYIDIVSSENEKLPPLNLTSSRTG